MEKTYYIKTFGCQANVSDSERVAFYLKERGLVAVGSVKEADWVVLNTCMVRRMAEDRIYGWLKNLGELRREVGRPERIVVTGCLVGMAVRDKSGKMLASLKQKWPMVDEWLPIEEMGLETLRSGASLPGGFGGARHAWVPVSNGCNNFCTYCVVPFTRGPEVSRPFEEILSECLGLASRGYTAITLLGQNVNSYGADLVWGKDSIWRLGDAKRLAFSLAKISGGLASETKKEGYRLPDGRVVRPTYVHHLGKLRIPTLFPQLLETICIQCPKFIQIEFVSSNPWDFSDELIKVVSKYPQVSRRIHLPVQSGSNKILKKMNRWYTRKEYLGLIDKIRKVVWGAEFTTDIIVGFPGETEEDFEETVDLVKRVRFVKAYVARYSPRPMTAASRAFLDDVSHEEKKRRWGILDQLINGQ